MTIDANAAPKEQRTMTKLQARDRAQLVVIAYQSGLAYGANGGMDQSS